MVTIRWCLDKKNGIELVESNDNLSQSYFKESKELLMDIKDNLPKWEVIKAYYCCYNALYAILMKAGIKCEIHDCSIELVKLIPIFEVKDYLFLIKLKDKRIANQYYLKNEKLEDLNEVKQFVFNCGKILDALDTDGINALREKIHEK